MKPYENTQYDPPPQQNRMRTAGNFDALMPELFNRLDTMQQQFNSFMQDGNKRLSRLEQIAAERGEKWDRVQAEYRALRDDFNRMESGLLQEFRISQEIMKAMIEHDMSVEKAKLDLRLEMEKQEKEFLQKQQEAELANEQARKDMARQMWIKIGGILLPLATAAATAASILIPKLFGQ